MVTSDRGTKGYTGPALLRVLGGFFSGQALATMRRKSTSGKRSRSAEMRGHTAKWHLLALAVFLAQRQRGALPVHLEPRRQQQRQLPFRIASIARLRWEIWFFSSLVICA